MFTDRECLDLYTFNNFSKTERWKAVYYRSYYSKSLCMFSSYRSTFKCLSSALSAKFWCFFRSDEDLLLVHHSVTKQGFGCYMLLLYTLVSFTSTWTNSRWGTTLPVILKRNHFIMQMKVSAVVIHFRSRRSEFSWILMKRMDWKIQSQCCTLLFFM